MIVNQEKFGKSGRNDSGGGIDIYDVANPAMPKLITEWRTIGGGVHRFDFDGRYAYISPTVEGRRSSVGAKPQIPWRDRNV